MAKTHKQRSRAKTPSIRSGRRRTVVAIAAVTLAVVGLGGYLGRWYTAAAPPAISLVELDPALAEAIETARREVWWHPHSAPAWARLGQLLFAHGYQAESNVCFAQAERLDPSDPRWPYLQGIIRQVEDPKAAIRHLQKAVALCGSVPDGTELCLAEVYLQQRRFDDAEQHFRHLLAQDPDHARAHLGLARLAHERGNLQDALGHLNRCAANKRTAKAAAILLAQIYHQLGDAAAAEREQSRSAELPGDSDWPDPFLEEISSLRIGKQLRLARLRALRRKGRTAEVRAVAEKLEDDYPDVYWLVEGRLQMDKGNLPAAEQALRKAIQLAADSVDAHFDLATTLFKQKRYRAAAESFRKVVELEPDYGQAYQGLGQCWMMQGNRTEALRAFQTAVHYMPQSAEAHRDLGDVLAQEGQVAEALVHLRQALQLQPEDAKARQLLDQVSKRAP